MNAFDRLLLQSEYTQQIFTYGLDIGKSTHRKERTSEQQLSPVLLLHATRHTRYRASLQDTIGPLGAWASAQLVCGGQLLHQNSSHYGTTAGTGGEATSQSSSQQEEGLLAVGKGGRGGSSV